MSRLWWKPESPFGATAGRARTHAPSAGLLRAAVAGGLIEIEAAPWVVPQEHGRPPAPPTIGGGPGGGRGDGRGKRSRPGWRGRSLLVLAALAVAAGVSVGAWAYLTASATAGSGGAAQATSVDQGPVPSVSLSGTGRAVDVSWGATTLANGVPVTGYLVTRYVDGGGPVDVNPFSTCAGTVTGTSCTETDVPPGQWQYTITPVIGQNWHGAASGLSGAVTIGAANLALTDTLFGGPAFSSGFAHTTGSLTGFAGGEGVSYNLDSDSPPSGTALTGSPSSVGADGSATIADLAVPENVGDGGHTVYALGDANPYPSQASAGIALDTTPPAVSAGLSPTPDAAGWNNTSVQVTLAENDPAPSAGDGAIVYTTDGTDPTTSATAQTYTGPITISAQGSTTIEYYGKDAAGNASTVQSQVVQIDTVPPTDNVSASVASGNAVLSGSTLWYRGVAGGSLTLSNAVADSLSGPASSSFSSLGGTTTGWTFSPGNVATPSGGPYVSGAFAWSPGTTSSPSETVTGYDVAANATSAPAITFTNDSAGPVGGSIGFGLNGLGGTGSVYSTSTTISLSLIAGSDAGVGKAAASTFLLERASASLSSAGGTSNGTCGTLGSFSTIATGPSASFTDNAADGIASGNCYEYKYVVSDLLGNQTTYTSAEVKVDTTAPSSPTAATLTPVSGTAYQYLSGSTLWYNPAQSGSFTVDSSSSDNESGISSLAFPTIPGFSGGGNVGSPKSGTTYEQSYSWSGNGGSSSPGVEPISATDNAGLTATDANAFTLTKDATAPTIGVSATRADSTTYTAGSWTNQTVTVHYSCSDPGGSGVASCPSDQSFSSDGVTSSTSGTATDNVGNTGSSSFGPIQIDKTSPTAASVVPAGATYTSGGGTIYVANGVSLTDAATDPTVGGASSGVASVKYQYCVGSSCTPSIAIGTATGGSGFPAGWTSQPADGTYQVDAVVTDNAGNSSTSAKTTVVIDNTPPHTTDNSASIGNGWKTANQTVTLTPSDSGSGVASTYFTIDGTAPTTGSAHGTSVVLSGDGLYTVKYFSVDNVANQEPVETAGTQIRIDKTAPNAGAVATSGAYTHSSTTYVKNGQALTDPTASDPTVNGASSGVASVTYFRCSAGCSGTTPTSSPGAWTLIGSASSGSYSVAWSQSIADGTYSLVAQAIDNAGNSSYSAIDSVVLDNTAPTTSAAFSPTPNASGWSKSTVTVTLNATDGTGSGIGSTTYSESGAQTLASTPYTGSFAISAVGTTTITYSSVDNVGNQETPAKTATVKIDETPPLVSVATITESGSTACEYENGTQAWYSTAGSCSFASGGFTVTANASDTGGSGVNDVLFPTFTGMGAFSGGGDDTTSPYSSIYSWTRNTTTSPTGTITATDLAGNQGTTTFSFTLDNTAPANSLSISSPNGAYFSSGNNTLYFNGNAAGSFTLSDALTDSGSGPASATFPSLSCSPNCNGWTHSNATVSTPAGGPFTSTYSWNSGSVATPNTSTITGTDHVGNTATTSLAFVADTSGPTGGALSVNGTGATGSGSSSTTTSTSFSISRTDYTSSIGLSSASTLTVQSETLTNGTCGSAGSGGPFTTAQTISGTSQPSGIAAGYCYLYKLTATDNVGITSSVQTTVSVTVPAPTISFPTSSNKETISRNTNNVTFTVTGSGFENGATVSIAGDEFTVVSTTFVDSGHLSVTVNATSHTGTTSLTVTNPDGGTVTNSNSMSNSFF